MFRESLLETSAATVAQRGVATAMSFGLEMAAIGILLVLPMAITQTIPMLEALPSVPQMTSVTPEQIRAAMNIMTGPQNDFNDGTLRYDGVIPDKIADVRDRGSRTRPAVADCIDCVYVPGFQGPAQNTPNVMNTLLHTDGPGRVLPPKPPEQTKPVQISRLDEGLLINRVEPKYPQLARIARAQGEVQLAALIDKDGRIVNLRVLNGNPMLVRAALEAVSQWRYRPYILNGLPVEVETTIAVNFRLTQN